MTGSYNETLSTMFSKNVRNSIQEEKADIMKPVFSDVFLNVRIKRGDGAMNLWSLDGGYNKYLATSNSVIYILIKLLFSLLEWYNKYT